MVLGEKHGTNYLPCTNEELQKLGYLTVAGRGNTNYFRKKVCYSEM